MKTLTLTLFFAFLTLWSFAQNSKQVADLKSQFITAKQDTVRVLLLAELAVLYQNANPDSAKIYAQQALDLAQKIKFLRGQARAYQVLGIITNVLGDIPNGFDFAYKGLQIAEENNFAQETANLYNALGFFFSSSLSDSTKALDAFRRGLAINKKAPDTKEKLSKEAQIYRNIGRIYQQSRQLDSANYYHHKALQIHRDAHIKYTATQINNLGRLEFALGHLQKAMAYSREAIQICKTENDHRFASLIYNTLAGYFRELNQLDSAVYYSKIGLTEAQSIGFKEGILQNSRLLALLYESIDLKKAYEYQKIAIVANEELNGIKKIQSLQKTITDELLRQRELEAERLAYQNRLRQTAFLAGLSLLLLIAFLLYRTNQKEKKAKNLLQEKNKEIESTLSALRSTQAQLIQSEKLASLGELTAGIAHEIQNPLNFVNNFSELSVDLAKELKEEIKKSDKDWELIEDLTNDLSQNQEKINHHGKRASSIVKGMLEHSKASTGKKESTDINALVDEYTRLAYSNLRSKNEDFTVNIETQLDETLPQIDLIPQDIGRVLLNIINNAFWAVQEQEKSTTEQGVSGYQPTIALSTKAEKDLLIITITDNGIGMSETTKAKIFQPFFTTKPTGEGTGLGLSLAYDIVTKGHGGTLEGESVEGEGSEFTIRLPLKTN
jgi:signal transduction histidine kinase